MGRSDLAVFGDAQGGRVGRGTVVQGHVGLDLVGVGAGGWFPAGFLCGGVEVVREVFGVGVPDLPLGGETGVGGAGLGREWVQKVVDGESGEEGALTHHFDLW